MKAVAIHTDPKPCILSREGPGEASVGEYAGWPLSRESAFFWCADEVTNSEGNTGRRGNASGGPTQRGQRTQHA